MEFVKFMNENKELPHENIKEKLEKKYKLRVILDYSNKFYMVKSTNFSDFKNPLVRQCTGIIVNKEDNKILHYFGEKTYDTLNNFNNNIIEKNKINVKNCFISAYINGYIIKVFYYNNEWIFASTKHTNIKYFKINNVSLYSMFKSCILESFNDIQDFLNLLNNNYCYTFMFNENKNNIYFINKVFLDDLVEDFNLNNFKSLNSYINISNLHDENKFIIIEKENGKIIKKICLSGKHAKALISNFTE